MESPKFGMTTGTKQGDRDRCFVGALAPNMSKFMGAMIHPLIRGIAFRPGNSKYKSNLLRKFTHRALSNTNLADTELEGAISDQLEQHKYGIALQTLKSQEVPFDTQTYFPKSFPETLPFVTQTTPQLAQAARDIFFKTDRGN